MNFYCKVLIINPAIEMGEMQIPRVKNWRTVLILLKRRGLTSTDANFGSKNRSKGMLSFFKLLKRRINPEININKSLEMISELR